MGIFDFVLGRTRADQDGSCPERAIIVASIGEEYQWAQHNCSGFTLGKQELQEFDGKPYDVLTLCSPSGEERRVYFDISPSLVSEEPGGRPVRIVGSRYGQTKPSSALNAVWTGMIRRMSYAGKEKWTPKIPEPN
jgi:hypothetical protein